MPTRKEVKRIKSEMHLYSLIVKYTPINCYMRAKAWVIVLHNAYMLGLVTESESNTLLGGVNK